ncbi:MAG: hypothetical protein MUC92_13595 [Fimbriimonadaceae bacterium]|jgi:hypothetical protein|nr:hypothetical protein [Fimbriimonadaceae bacterium]
MAVAPFPNQSVAKGKTYTHRVQRKPRARVARQALAWPVATVLYLTLFGFVALLSFGFSVLLGNSMMEHARREGAKVTIRAKQARSDVARLRQTVDRQVTMAAVDDWARGRGFLSPYDVPPSEDLVPNPDYALNVR